MLFPERETVWQPWLFSVPTNGEDVGDESTPTTPDSRLMKARRTLSRVEEDAEGDVSCDSWSRRRSE